MDEFTKVKIVIVFLTAVIVASMMFYALGVSRATEVEQEKCRQELAAPHKLEVVITDKTCSCTEVKTETGNE